MNDSESKPSLPPPELSADPGVHLWYMRRDISEIKTSINELKNSYVTQKDFSEHLKADEDHENRIRTIEQNMWKQIGTSSVISALGSAILLSVAQHFIH